MINWWLWLLAIVCSSHLLQGRGLYPMTYFCVCFYELHLWVYNPMFEELYIINASFTPICYPFHELQCYFVLYRNRAHCNGSFGISVNHRSGAHLFPINSSLERNNIRGLKVSSFHEYSAFVGKTVHWLGGWLSSQQRTIDSTVHPNLLFTVLLWSNLEHSPHCNCWKSVALQLQVYTGCDVM